MKLIIAGSRDFDISIGFIEGRIDLIGYPREVVSGNAKGVDQAGLRWAEAQIRDMPIKIFNPDWGTHGKAAGPIRNKQMAEYSDALLLIWDGESKGSKNMKEEMLKLNKPVYEFIIKQY